jgi:hypothetical protein
MLVSGEILIGEVEFDLGDVGILHEAKEVRGYSTACTYLTANL